MAKHLLLLCIFGLLQLHFAGIEGDVFSSALNTVSGMFGNSGRKASWTESKKLFHEGMTLLKREFPSQTRNTWLQLLSTIETTLKLQPPEKPAVITVLIPPIATPEFGECFTFKVALTLNKATADIFQRDQPSIPLALTNLTFERKSTTQIHNEVESYLNTRGKAIIVSGIDYFKNERDLLIFHGLFVDARATLLFPVVVPENIYEKFRNKWRHDLGATISHEVLTQAWKTVVPNNIGPAVIAKVADAVILLNPGDNCKLSSTLMDEEEIFSDITTKDNPIKEKNLTKEDVENIVESEITKLYNMLLTSILEKLSSYEDVENIVETEITRLYYILKMLHTSMLEKQNSLEFKLNQNNELSFTQEKMEILLESKCTQHSNMLYAKMSKQIHEIENKFRELMERFNNSSHKQSDELQIPKIDNERLERIESFIAFILITTIIIIVLVIIIVLINFFWYKTYVKVISSENQQKDNQSPKDTHPRQEEPTRSIYLDSDDEECSPYDKPCACK